MGKYDEKTAVITGGASGLGLATAELLLDAGARVMVTGHTAATLDAGWVLSGVCPTISVEVSYPEGSASGEGGPLWRLCRFSRGIRPRSGVTG